MDKMRKPSDLSYKNFFSYPIMVMALFQEYVLKPLVGILDFSTLERLNGEYVSPELLERRNDIVWRVNLKNNSSEYLVVILEFQSRPDNLMGFRIQSYSTLLFLDIGRRKRPLKKHPLPYVFPIVMYNGKTPWRIPLDAGSLFPSIPNVLKRYRPKQSYMLLDERYIPDDELKKRNGLVTQLIKLERAKSLDDLAPIFRRLEELLPDPEYASLNNMFTLWAEYVLKCAGLVEESRKFRNLQEVNMIVGRATLKNAANWKNAYIQEGREEGREEGEKKAMAKLLLVMLEERFGAIPEAVNSFIASSDSDSLMSLFRFANKAPSMQSITDRISGKLALS